MKRRIGVILVIVFLLTGCGVREKITHDTVEHEEDVQESDMITVTEAIEKQESLTTTPTPEVTKEANDNFLLGTWIVSDEKNFLIEYIFDEEILTVVCKYEQEDYKSCYKYKVLDGQLHLYYLGKEVSAVTLKRTSDDIVCIVDEGTSVTLYRKDSKEAQEVLKNKEDYWIGDWILVDENFEPVSYWSFKSKDELVCKKPGEKEQRINYKSRKSDEKIELIIDKKTYEMYQKYARIYINDGENEYAFIKTDSLQLKEFMEVINKDGSKEQRSYQVDDVCITLTAPNNILLNKYIQISHDKKCRMKGAYGDYYEVSIASLDTKDATLSFEYKREDLLYNCEQDLAIGFMDTKTGTTQLLQTKQDLKLQSVSATYQGDGYYYLVDKYIADGNIRDLGDANPYATAWAKNNETGDICSLVDMNYIKQSNGFFTVHNAVELASAVFYANTQDNAPVISLANDIDLSPYQWAPMGWGNMDDDYPFSGTIQGNSHVISGMNIQGEHDLGFLGWSTFCQVSNLTIKDAVVKGDRYIGILNGQEICGHFYNCCVSGAVEGNSTVGTMFGHEANGKINDCSANVTVNGKENKFLSSNEEEISKIVVENKVTITLGDDYTVTRPEVEGFRNLGWVIKINGEEVLVRNAESELSYQYKSRCSGEYEIYLTAFVQGQYVPVSNSVFYTIP